MTNIPIEARRDIVGRAFVTLVENKPQYNTGMHSFAFLAEAILNDECTDGWHNSVSVKYLKKNFPDVYELLVPWLD
jgi:hypothetical protein